MDLRPQAHDIIRTWAFYTIAKSALHEGSIPWKNIALSGWILDPDRKKMSKSKGNVVTPMEHLERFTADGVRYWAGCARLGTDTAFEEKMLQVGKRLVTKIYNAGKFVLSQQGPRSPISCQIDRAFLAKLSACAQRATEAMEDYESAKALSETETFFWTSFTDAYIELVKGRAKGAPPVDPAAQGSAVEGLRLALNVLLRLFAPFLPYVTEEVWSWAFAKETGLPSIHLAPWPRAADFQTIALASDWGGFEAPAAALAAIHRHKTLSGMSVGAGLGKVVLAGNARSVSSLQPSVDDVLGAARAAACELEERPDLEDMRIEVVRAEPAPETGGSRG